MPHSIEAEQSVLGAILLEPSAVDTAMIELRVNEFYNPQNRKIYQAMVDLARDAEPIDLTVLTAHLQEKGWLDQTGGVLYLSDLARMVPTAANIGSYIGIVKERYMQRQLIEAAEEMSSSAFRTEDLTQTVSEAQAKLDNLIADSSPRKNVRTVSEILKACYYQIEIKHANRDGTGVTGIPSGYDSLDLITAGFQNSDLIIVGARPSVGKTAFAMNISRNAAVECGKTIAVFSLEMSAEQLVNRMISAEALIDSSRIRSGHLIDDDWEKLAVAVGLLDEYPIVIDDTPGITVQEIRVKCRRLKKEYNLGMIVIDYLQLIEAIQRSGINRQQEITEITRKLKQIARELEVPVIALSQLSRGVEQRQDKRPMLSDLRESGSIEQDADIVAFLYRDDYYNKESDREGIIEIIIAKQRNGPLGTVELAFLKNFNKFVNLDRTHSQAAEPVPNRAIPSNNKWRRNERYKD